MSENRKTRRAKAKNGESKSIKLKNSIVLSYFALFVTMLKVNYDEMEMYNFRKFIIQLKKCFEKINEETREHLEKVQEEIKELKIKYANKDKNGNCIIIRNQSFAPDGKAFYIENYEGLVPGENKKFDEELDKKEKEIKKILKFKSEIDLGSIDPIEKKDIPWEAIDFIGEMQEVLFELNSDHEIIKGL